MVSSPFPLLIQSMSLLRTNLTLWPLTADTKSKTESISQLLTSIQDDFSALKAQLVPAGKKSKRTTSAKWRK